MHLHPTEIRKAATWLCEAAAHSYSSGGILLTQNTRPFLCSPNVCIFSALMHHISSGCWSLLPCILKTRSCTLFSGGRDLPPSRLPLFPTLNFLFPFGVKKLQSEPISGPPPPSGTPSLSAAESNVLGFIFINSEDGH